jgi:hypothetical protein
LERDPSQNIGFAQVLERDPDQNIDFDQVLERDPGQNIGLHVDKPALLPLKN